ncbi:unnamed protein product [Mucor hiemalis]
MRIFITLFISALAFTAYAAVDGELKKSTLDNCVSRVPLLQKSFDRVSTHCTAIQQDEPSGLSSTPVTPKTKEKNKFFDDILYLVKDILTTVEECSAVVDFLLKLDPGTLLGVAKEVSEIVIKSLEVLEDKRKSEKDDILESIVRELSNQIFQLCSRKPSKEKIVHTILQLLEEFLNENLQ